MYSSFTAVLARKRRRQQQWQQQHRLCEVLVIGFKRKTKFPKQWQAPVSPSTTTTTTARRIPATVVVIVRLEVGRLRLVVLTVPWVKVHPMEARGAHQDGERNGDSEH